jgi:hypothetical protein
MERKEHIWRMEEFDSEEIFDEDGTIVTHWNYGSEIVLFSGTFIGMKFH